MGLLNHLGARESPQAKEAGTSAQHTLSLSNAQLSTIKHTFTKRERESERARGRANERSKRVRGAAKKTESVRNTTITSSQGQRRPHSYGTGAAAAAAAAAATSEARKRVWRHTGHTSIIWLRPCFVHPSIRSNCSLHHGGVFCLLPFERL